MVKTVILQELAESRWESEGGYVNSDTSEEADIEEFLNVEELFESEES